MTGAVNAKIGEGFVELRAHLSKLQEDLNKGQKMFSDRMKSFGKQSTQVGKDLNRNVGLPLSVFGGLTLRAAGNFEAGMNRVKAVSGATEDQFKKLEAQAKQLGATTQFSAGQAADAMSFLAMAGFDANEIMGALPGTLQLAASAQMDLGSAADIVSNILSGYNKDVSELAHVNDVLVKTLTSTNTDLLQLGEAMKYAGPVASAAGVQFEEAAAAIGIMGNSGIQASMAGTSLRGAIARLLDPADGAAEAMEKIGLKVKDSEGRLLSLTEIIKQLEPHANDAGLFMEIFGLRAGPAFATLAAEGSEALKKLTTELENSGGTAERIANVQMQGFNGMMKEMRSGFEAMMISIAASGFLEFMGDMGRGLASVFRWIATLNPEILKWGTIIAGLAISLGPLALAIGAVSTAMGILAPLLPVIVGGLAAMMSPIGLLVGAIGGLTLAWATWGDDVTLIVQNTVTAVKEWLGNKFGAIVAGVKEKIDAVKGFFFGMYDAVVGHSWVPDMVDGIKDEFGKLDDVMVKPTEEATDKVNKEFEKLAKSTAVAPNAITGNLMSGIVEGEQGLIGLGQTGGTIAGQLGDSFRKLFTQSVSGQFDDLGSAFSGMLGTMANNLINSGLDGLMGSILGGGAVGGMSGGGIGGLLKYAAPLFGGFFADGGRPPLGKVSMVGERGPELFVPDSAGTIIPNEALGGGNQTVNISIDARGAQDGVEHKITAALRSMEKTLVNQTADLVVDRAQRGGSFSRALRGA